MALHLRHRGPEGEGYRLDAQAGLAHTRLSIIDLEGGAQPISNETGTVWVVLNGEIFNYVELREELSGRGHRFRTHTDTEVLVHLYEDLGEGFVHRLNGQFAIGLWDSDRRVLILARDRVGIVPLFFSSTGNRFAFASEVKALLPVLGRPSLDPVALDQILTFWAPLAPRTPFSGVQDLPSGHIAVVGQDGVDVRRYWDWTFPTSADGYHSGSEATLAAELLDLLLDSTRIRLRSDVPVGAYLSGGLDSSSVVSLVHEVDPSVLRTFSIRFDAEGLDESSFQRQMMGHLGTDHSEVVCSPADVSAHFLDTIRHTEAPILRTAPTPMQLLSALVRRNGYKVVLTGEGADETLGGYDLFKEAKVRRFWSRQPDSSWRHLLLQRLYPYLDLSAGRSQEYVKRFFSIGLDDPDSALFSHRPRWETTSMAKMFFSRRLAEELSESATEALEASLPEGVGLWHPFNRSQYLEAKSLLPGYLLSSQGDRMLMANGVEGRFPFLDHRLIEFANGLDPRLKMKVLNEKHLLKKAMDGRLPPDILKRWKQPYRAPDIQSFFANGGARASYVDDLLSYETVARYGYFEPKRVRLLVEKARSGAASGVKDNQAFTGILSTQIWHYLFVERFHADFAGDSNLF